MNLTAEEKIPFGKWSVCSLYDGYFDLDQHMFVNGNPDDFQQLLDEAGIACISPLVVRTPVFGFLVDTGEHLVLVDSGCGLRCGENTGFLNESLKKWVISRKIFPSF